MIAGIDNGLDGAVVILNGRGEVVGRHVMPTLKLVKSKRDFDLAELRTILLEIPAGEVREIPVHVFLERAQAMPGQGVSSMFTTGKGFGINLGMLAALQIPYTIVSPQVWQREMFKGLPKDGKQTARIVCQQLWPKVDWRASARCRVAHDGLCDAALIAEYGRRQLVQKGAFDA